ncbi:MAG: ATP-binding protein [Campylobacterota bacterium]|nr:ATP-binding protein [Campylobacterota bacterium]
MNNIILHKHNKIIKSIILAALVMLASIFFFVPYITEKYIISAASKQALLSIDKIKLTRQYYVKRVVNDIKSQKNHSMTFNYEHEGKIGVLPLPATLIHDLSRLFSDKHTGTSYRLYSKYPFKNRLSRTLNDFQQEAIDFTTKNPNDVLIKRDKINDQEVLHVAVPDRMSAQSCVACHNNHPQRTWPKGKWRLGETRGVLDATISIEDDLMAMKEIRDYILAFISIIFFIVLYYLYRVLRYREQELTDVANEFESEVNVLNTLVNEHVIISKTNLNGMITYVSNEFCRLSGYSREELMGSSHNIIRHPDVSKSVFSDIWKTIKNDDVWTGDMQNRAKNGSTYYVYAKIFPYYDSKQNKIGYVGIRDDITQRILSQKKLEQVQTLHKTITDNQQSILVMTNKKQGVVSFNKRFFELFDFQNFKEFKEKHECICELFIEKENYITSDYNKGEWIEAIVNNPDILHKALMKNKKGKERIFSILSKKVILNKETFYVSTLTDITELEQAREAAESSGKAKTEFMANMSHELRTPLNGVTGFTKLLEETPLSEQQSKYLSIITSSVGNLLKIINNILDFSKIESGKMVANYIMINPYIDFEKALKIFSSTAKEKNIHYNVNISTRISECLYVDNFRLTQIFYNLINNAMKFTPKKGTVTVAVELLSSSIASEKLRFSVKDTGIGISKENQTKVFEVFSQADSSTTREFGGTGLGLSISASLVEILGGRLQLESEEGAGSYFFFDLNFKKCTDEPMSFISEITGQPIYILKDNNTNIDAIVEQLKHFDVSYKVLEHNSKEKKIIKSSICIVFNSEDLALCDDETNQVIFIFQSDMSIAYPPHIRHIHDFEAFPSILYNTLMDLNRLKSNNEDQALIEVYESMKLNILIAEDNITNQILLEELLIRYDIIPTFVQNGKEAVSQANGGYDIIFMDINMPIMSGMEATKIIRENGNTIPIIALTANALKGDRERFLEAGMDDYISKPIDSDALDEVLKKYGK